jgi:tetratricopeptide (TPR) repeat protein
MGGAYSGTGEYELALREYAKAADLDSSMVPARIGIARVNVRQGNLGVAKKVLIGLTKGMRYLGTVHRLLADILMQERSYTEAVAEFEAAVLHSKNLVEKHPELTAVQRVAGNDQKTAEAYQLCFAKVDVDSAIDLEVVVRADLDSDDDLLGGSPDQRGA